MNLELVVIADHQAAVNTFSGLVQIKLRLPATVFYAVKIRGELDKNSEAKWHPFFVRKMRRGPK